jgi:hypothetical protein
MTCAIAEVNGHKLAYPACSFDELFCQWQWYKYGKEHSLPACQVTGSSLAKALLGLRKPNGAPDLIGSMTIGPFCSLSGFDTPDGMLGLSVLPHDAVVEAVKEHTIIVDKDSMSWEIIRWDGSRALVLCKHGTIIGDVWLAVIDPSTVPRP